MSLDTTALSRSMIDAARNAVAEQWPALRSIAEVELRTLAHSLAEVTALHEAGEIPRSHAQQLVRMHQTSAASVLATIEGIGLLSANRAVDAASSVAAIVINRIAGFRLVAAFKAGKDL